MKRKVSLSVLIALTVNCTYIIPRYEFEEHEIEGLIIISERVGETIDAEEREQFGLFAEIAEFKEARFFELKSGGCVVEIATEGYKFVAVNRDQDAMLILRDYVDRYDEISIDRTAFESKWGILAYDTLGVPITENEVNATIAQSRRSASTAGILGCVLPPLLFAGLGAAIGCGWMHVEIGGSDVTGPLIGVMIGAAVGSVIALVYAPIAYFTRYRKNVDVVVKAIKESRKPRVVENR